MRKILFILLSIIFCLNVRSQQPPVGVLYVNSGHAPTTIAFVSAVDGGNNSGLSTSLSYSFTVSGGNDRFLLVVILGDAVVGGANDISSVTYNGDALTHIMTTTDGGSLRYKYLYYLLNPDAGSNNVVITAGSSHYIFSGASEYTGVQGIDNTGSNTSGIAATTLTSSITPVANNSWMIIAEDGYNGNAAPTAGAGATRRAFDGTFGAWGLFDNNAAINPAASTNMTTDRSTAANVIGHAIVTIKPY